MFVWKSHIRKTASLHSVTVPHDSAESRYVYVNIPVSATALLCVLIQTWLQLIHNCMSKAYKMLNFKTRAIFRQHSASPPNNMYQLCGQDETNGTFDLRLTFVSVQSGGVAQSASLPKKCSSSNISPPPAVTDISTQLLWMRKPAFRTNCWITRHRSPCLAVRTKTKTQATCVTVVVVISYYYYY
jgi:hypothetical protein